MPNTFIFCLRMTMRFQCSWQNPHGYIYFFGSEIPTTTKQWLLKDNERICYFTLKRNSVIVNSCNVSILGMKNCEPTLLKKIMRPFDWLIKPSCKLVVYRVREKVLEETTEARRNIRMSVNWPERSCSATTNDGQRLNLKQMYFLFNIPND